MITLTPSTTVPNSYSLNWGAQQSHIFDGLKNLVGQDDVLLTDVTLACDGEYVQAHKLVLSLCSSFFKDLFQKNKADKSNTIIILGNVSAQNLRYLLQFMYQGKVDIPSKDVDNFLQAGNMLKVEGLIGSVGDTGQPPSAPSTSHAVPSRPTRSYAQPGPASKKPAASASATSDSSATPIKRARLSEQNASSASVSHPEIRTSHSVGSIEVDQSSHQSSAGVADPLDDAGQFHPGEIEGDGEEDIDFHHLKTEPIHVFSGYEEDEDQSDMLQGEGVEDDSYGESGEDSFGLPPSSTLNVSAPVPVSVPAAGPSSSSQVGRTRGSMPGVQRLEIKDKTQDESKFKSGVWLYFRRTIGFQAQCGICRLVINRNGKSTTQLRNHLLRKHPAAFQKVKEYNVVQHRDKEKKEKEPRVKVKGTKNFKIILTDN